MPSSKFRRTFIVGCGSTAYMKPRGERTIEEMSLEAVTKALLDAGVTYDAIEAGFVGFCYSESMSGQSALYHLGMTGIPITNVNNNCSTGSTALVHAANSVKTSLVECALALGFERMASGSLVNQYPDRLGPTVLFGFKSVELEETLGEGFGPMAPRLFSNGGKEYCVKHGANVEHFAKIASKNHKHAVNNPYAQFRDGWTEEQVLNSPKITDQLTKLMCTPTSDGASCCIVASEDFVRAHKLENQAIEIVAQVLETDEPSAFESSSPGELVGYGTTKRCADKVFSQAGFALGHGRDEVGVIELHDCFAPAELFLYDALGLCAPGTAHKMVDKGDNTYGGKYVINPSGGLEARGHPIGATGLGMHFSITMQLRGWSGISQAPNLFSTPDKRGKYGLVHNVGLGSAAVVSLLRRPEFFEAGGEDGRTRLGYNHATECRPITMADLDKVKAKKSSKYVLQAGLAKL
ncbi:thiolase-like protein [Boletus edulis BED1]|uniref:Thiolase-like protein n=1 Tax=Boletus edulis BED1 TaxID=1328754 RepID=A0AAD4BUH4_BOLED|nr:thiolase-like protein [Boletus edulis BED1]